jgi:nucleoside phosphorylase
MKLLILAAFPRELRKTVRMAGGGTRIHGHPFRALHVRHPAHALTVVETGLGVENAGRVFLGALQAGRPDAVISLGYCGALSHDAAVGDLIWASRIHLVDGERIETLSLPQNRRLLEALCLRLPIRAGTFLTLKEWKKKRELARFAVSGMPLPVCDMETFGLARLSLQRKLPFFAIRAVSDEAGVELAFDPLSVCDDAGTYRLTRALRLFLTHPRLLAQAAKLRGRSKIASAHLALAVRALLEVLQPGAIPEKPVLSRRRSLGEILKAPHESSLGRDPVTSGPHERDKKDRRQEQDEDV